MKRQSKQTSGSKQIKPKQIGLIGDFKGKRWLKISLRTIHIFTIIGVGGAILFNIPFSQWVWYWYAAMASGLMMIAIDALSNFLWLVQVRGIVIYLKLALLMLLGSNMLVNQLVLIVVVVLSAVISHAPGSVRYFSLAHLRTINSYRNSKG